MILPSATGMGIVLTLLTLKQTKPLANTVLWTRIDQKSCIKAIKAAGLELEVIPNLIEGDELRTNLEVLESTINKIGVDNILCVVSTTSCFAPRSPDK